MSTSAKQTFFAYNDQMTSSSSNRDIKTPTVLNKAQISSANTPYDYYITLSSLKGVDSANLNSFKVVVVAF